MMDKVQALESKSLGPTFGTTIYLWVHRQETWALSGLSFLKI